MKGKSSWVLIVTLLAFGLSLVMSFLAEIVLKNVTLAISLIVTFLFILLRRVRGGKIGVKLIKNASKVSSICCDVVGDICGIISGSAGVTIITLIIKMTDINPLIVTLLVTALISSLTIGGKALGKGLAINKSDEVITAVAKLLSIFSKK